MNKARVEWPGSSSLGAGHGMRDGAPIFKSDSDPEKSPSYSLGTIDLSRAVGPGFLFWAEDQGRMKELIIS
jgi:hypothetical protein